MANTFGAASKWSDVLNDAGCVALGSKGSPRCKREIDESPIHEADPLAQHPRAGRFPDQLPAQTKRFRDCENRCCPGAALTGNSTFLRARRGRVFDQEWTAPRQTLGREPKPGRSVRWHVL